MAILQCLNCGRPNPDFLDNCQYCGKALKPGGKTEPLGDEGTAEGTKPFGQAVDVPPEDLDIPEWLRNTGNLPPLKTEPEVPAWLKAATDELKPLPPASEDVPDWLKAASKPLIQPAPSEPEQGDIPDWLKAMGAGSTGPLAEETPPAAPVSPAASDIPDWLQTATGPLDAEKPAPANTGDLPDWLQRATGQLPPQAPAPSASLATGPITGPIEEEVPDWLKSMGGTGPMATPAKNEPTGPIQEDVPDWLKGMGGSGGTAPFAEPIAPEPTAPSAGLATGPITGPIEEEVPDWLKSMGGTGPMATPAKNEPTGPIQEDVPDWLKSVGGTAPFAMPVTPEPEPAAEQFTAAEDMPDWLKAATGQLPPTPAAPPSGEATGPIEEEVPDWLRSTGGTSPFAVPVTPEPEPASPVEQFTAAEAEDMPDWLKAATGQLPAEPTAPAAGEPTGPIQEDVPDWLKSVGGTGPIAAPAAEPVQEEAPEWLQSTPSSGGTAPFGLPATPEATGAADLPDWLKMATGPLQPGSVPLPEPAKPETPAPVPGLQTGELPDWLKTATGPLEKPSTPVNTGELPDWLKAATGPLTPPADLPAAPPAGELPDWLQKSTGPLPPAVQTAPEISAEPQPDWLSDIEKAGDDLGLIGAGVVAADITLGATETPAATPAGDEPDWLRALQSGAPAEAAPVAEPASSEPNWLSDLREEPEAPAATAAGGDEPDWMAALRPTAKAEPQTTYVPPEELTQGELPTWLSALRPVDAGAHLEPEQDAYQETVGVLSGMRGVLRAEPSVVLPGKAASQIHTLDVTPEQNQQAAAFLKLLQADSETVSTKPKPKLSLPWLRWLVTVLLVVSLLAPMVFRNELGAWFLTPTQRSVVAAEVADTFITVDKLPTNKSVLVAFEYEPGQQGEIGLLAETVLTHLMRRGIRLVGISTSPTGAAVGQEMFNRLALMPIPVQASSYTYVDGENYINLGYLPGGPVGIAQFVNAPQSTSPQDFRGQFGGANQPKLWELAPLRNITTLQDFGAVLVMAATPESARIWFEQTEAARSAGGRVPIIFVTSASAAPLVRPYFEAERQGRPEADPQAGFISGPTGILQYEAKAGTAGTSLQSRFDYWDMTGYGALLVGVLLLLGNLFYGLRQLWRQQRGKAA